MNGIRPAILIGMLGVAAVLQAQSTPPALSDVALAPAPVPYLPSVADLMTSTVQPRHVKLGLAVQDGNWSYAAYETSELRGAFRRIIRTIPVYDQKTNTESLMSMIFPPLEVIETAVKAKDAAGARQAFSTLTATCNACHQQTLNRKYLVIVDPKATAFPDQDFRHH